MIRVAAVDDRVAEHLFHVALPTVPIEPILQLLVLFDVHQRFRLLAVSDPILTGIGQEPVGVRNHIIWNITRRDYGGPPPRTSARGVAYRGDPCAPIRYARAYESNARRRFALVTGRESVDVDEGVVETFCDRSTKNI